MVICTRDLLGEMPVKDERIESKDRGAEPSDHNAGQTCEGEKGKTAGISDCSTIPGNFQLGC